MVNSQPSESSVKIETDDMPSIPSVICFLCGEKMNIAKWMSVILLVASGQQIICLDTGKAYEGWVPHFNWSHPCSNPECRHLWLPDMDNIIPIGNILVFELHG